MAELKFQLLSNFSTSDKVSLCFDDRNSLGHVQIDSYLYLQSNKPLMYSHIVNYNLEISKFQKQDQLKSDNNISVICIELRITFVISICNEVEFDFCVILVC